MSYLRTLCSIVALLPFFAQAQIANYHLPIGGNLVNYTPGVPFQITVPGGHSGFCGETWRLAIAFRNLPAGWSIVSITSDNPGIGTGPFVQDAASQRMDDIVAQNCSNYSDISAHYLSPLGSCGSVTSTLTITIMPTTPGVNSYISILAAVSCDCDAQLNSTTCNLLLHSESALQIRNPDPVLDPGFIGTDQTLCAGTAPSALASVLPASSGVPPYAYQWQQASTAAGPWSDVPQSGNNIDYTPATASGTVYYRRRVTDAAAPSSIAYTNVVSITANPAPQATIAPVPATLCDDVLNLSPTAVNGTGSWSIVGAPVGSQASFNGNVLENITPAGSYTLRYTVSGTGCPDAVAEVTVVREIPPVANAGVDKATCQNTTQLNAVGGVGVWTLVSSPAGTPVSISSQNLGEIDGMTEAGEYIFRYTVGSGACGIATDEVTVYRQPSQLDFVVTEVTPQQGYVAARQYSLQAPVAPGSQVVWNFTNGTPATYIGLVPPVIQYSGFGDFEIGVEISINPPPHPCIITHSELIHIQPPVYKPLLFPNVFSPNSDGLNDTFYPLGGPPQDYSIQIFSRWGTLVYQGRQVQPGWDGTAPNGDPVPEGVYVYIARYTLGGAPLDRTGTVTLLR